MERFPELFIFLCYRSEPILAHCSISILAENLKKNFNFLTFSVGAEIEHWAKVGLTRFTSTYFLKDTQKSQAKSS